MKSEYYYRLPTGHEEGPFTGTQLKHLAQLGEITAITAIRKGLDGNWIAAEKIKGLIVTPIAIQLPAQKSLAKRRYFDEIGDEDSLQQINGQVGALVNEADFDDDENRLRIADVTKTAQIGSDNLADKETIDYQNLHKNFKLLAYVGLPFVIAIASVASYVFGTIQGSAKYIKISNDAQSEMRQSDDKCQALQTKQNKLEEELLKYKNAQRESENELFDVRRKLDEFKSDRKIEYAKLMEEIAQTKSEKSSLNARLTEAESRANALFKLIKDNESDLQTKEDLNAKAKRLEKEQKKEASKNAEISLKELYLSLGRYEDKLAYEAAYKDLLSLNFAHESGVIGSYKLINPERSKMMTQIVKAAGNFVPDGRSHSLVETWNAVLLKE